MSENIQVNSENTELIPNHELYQEKPGGQFKKGNPGKPKGSKGLTTLVREALLNVADEKGTTYEKQLIKVILNKAIVEQDSNIIKLIWNYLDGMPKQDIDLNAVHKLFDSITDDDDQPTESQKSSQLGTEQLAEGCQPEPSQIQDNSSGEKKREDSLRDNGGADSQDIVQIG